jgi:hypothetical protein
MAPPKVNITIVKDTKGSDVDEPQRTKRNDYMNSPQI